VAPLQVGHRTARIASVGLTAALLGALVAPGLGLPASRTVAASATTVDVSPEHGGGPTGATVTLTARVYDESGSLYVGDGSSTHVRFFFDPASPNDIDSPGNSPDLGCHTGTSGTCSVSYVAAVPGRTSSVRSSAAPPRSATPRRSTTTSATIGSTRSST
jgi:hypothetical protein